MATVINAIEATQEKVIADALTWPNRAKALTIASHPTYVQAGELLTGIKALRKEVDAAFDPIISKAHEAHKEACGQKKKAEAPLLEAEQILKHGLIAYDTEQERIRREEQRRLEEEARVIEEQRRLEEAAALERQATATGDESLRADAERLINEPVTVPSVYVPPSIPKVAGISYRENWRVDPDVDIRKLAGEIAAGRQPAALLIPNLPALNAQARSLKGELKIPGVKVICEKVASAGSR